MPIGTGIAILGIWIFPSACVLSGNFSYLNNVSVFSCTVILTVLLLIWRDPRSESIGKKRK